MTYKLVNNDTGNENSFDSYDAAQEEMQNQISLGAGEDALEIVEVDEEKQADGGAEVVEPAPIDDATEGPTPNVVERVDAPDPNKTLPHWMLTEIQHGNDVSVDLNKRGTQVVASRLGLEVNAECEIEARETDFEYCRYRATARTEDGKEFTAVGDAHIDEDGKDKWDLERLAETRAKKRAVKWSTAGGVKAFEDA